MFKFEYEYIIPICIQRSGICLICYKNQDPEHKSVHEPLIMKSCPQKVYMMQCRENESCFHYLCLHVKIHQEGSVRFEGSPELKNAESWLTETKLNNFVALEKFQFGAFISVPGPSPFKNRRIEKFSFLLVNVKVLRA